MTSRINAVNVWGVGLCLVATACGSADETSVDETVSLELATHVAALEVNQDGGDIEDADATSDQPLLMRSCGLAQVREKLVERFDADESSELDADELSELSEEYGGAIRRNRSTHRRVARWMRLRRLLGIYDVDDSGDLDDAERTALESDLESRCEARQAELLERFDADGSGSLDDEEWRTAHEAIRERFHENRKGLLDRFDDNEDGRLGPLERHVVHQEHRDQIEERRDTIRDEFDVDEDGRLDEEERVALRDQMRENVRRPGRGGERGRATADR